MYTYIIQLHIPRAPGAAISPTILDTRFCNKKALIVPMVLKHCMHGNFKVYLLRYSVLFTVESLSLLYLHVIS